MDQENLLAVLNDWNYWKKDFPDIYKRPLYGQEIEKKSYANEVLFIKGVRRSGKSTMLVDRIKNLVSQGVPIESILFVNLEDPRLLPHLSLDLLENIKHCHSRYLNPRQKPHIFLDEVQNIDQFEKWLLKEYELSSSHLYATGSNSKLLSKEIGTALSGRYLDVEVYPLSFREFLAFKNLDISNKLDLLQNKIEIERYFEEYMDYGGFPKVVLLEDQDLKKYELKNYFDSILLRDIVVRYRLGSFNALERLAIRLLSSMSNIVSISSLKKSMGLSYDAVSSYIEYLENAYMLFRVPLFDWSLKKQQANPCKVYAIDTGLVNRVSFKVGKRTGDQLENIVFLELKRHNEEIYYYKTPAGYEVDFLCKAGERITQLIQVSARLDDAKTRAREIRALIKAKQELKYCDNTRLIVLTLDPGEMLSQDNHAIEIVNVLEWLGDL